MSETIPDTRQTQIEDAAHSTPASPHASGLLLLGVNHTTAPIAVRERLAIPGHRLADATRTLADQPGIREALILSTCNRVEILTVQDGVDQEHAEVRAGLLPPTLSVIKFLHDYLQIRETDLEPHVYEYRERDAIRHLFRVASSLDSMVVGEPQILGQVKQSWTVGREVGAVKTMLDPLLQRAFSVAKKVRTETQIGNTTVSVASVAAELARKIFGSLAGKTVLLVGAGKMSDLTARHLIQQGATTLLVANRTETRAQGDCRCAADPEHHDRRDSTRSTARTSASRRHRDHEHGRGSGVYARECAGGLAAPQDRPVFFIDIAVPRDVAPEVNKVDGCFVYDIDDLQQVAMQNKAVRNREAEAAESIVTREVARYSDRISQAPVTESIKELLLSAEEVRQHEIARTMHQLATQPLTPEQLAAVDRLTKSLTGKLLHPQIAALREMAAERDSDV